MPNKLIAINCMKFYFMNIITVFLQVPMFCRPPRDKEDIRISHLTKSSLRSVYLKSVIAITL